MTSKANISGYSSTFSFTIILDCVDEFGEQLEKRLVESGCDHASLTSRAGLVYLKFDREAESLSGAVGSAIDDIETAGYRVASIGIGQRDTDQLKAELSAWESASDEDFEAFESRLE